MTYVFTHELPTDGDMNGEVVKAIISGGDKQTGRETGGHIQHFTLDIMLIVCCNFLPVITPCDKAIEDRMSLFLPPYKYVKPYMLASPEAQDNWRAADPKIKDYVWTEEFQLAMLELMIKSYVCEEPDRPPSVAADTAHMIAKSSAHVPGSQVDLKPYVEYTGRLTDYIVFDELKKLIESDGIKHIDNKIIVAALTRMGDLITITRARLPGVEGQPTRYTGVKLRPSMNPNMSSYVPERDFPAFFNREVAKRQYHHDAEIDDSDSD
jgi:hypothetical protein